MTDLRDATDDVDADARHVEPEPITDEAEDRARAQANLYLRALRALDRDRRRIQDEYDEERERLDSWLRDRTSGLDRRRDQLVAILESFGRSWKSRFGEAPRKFVYGRVTLTPPRDSLVVVDEAAFRDWAEGNARLDLLTISVDPNKNAIKDALKPAGEAEVPDPDPERRYRALATPEGEPVPGVVLSAPVEESVSVKVNE